MDTGQPLVTTSEMPNHLSDHHKVYYTYIEMYIRMYNTMCLILKCIYECIILCALWSPGRIFDRQQNLSFLLSEGPY